MLVLILGLLLFFGAHSVAIVAPYWRDRMVLLMGAPQWKGMYAMISLAGFLAIIWGYGLARHSPVSLYVPPAWLRYGTFVLMLPVFPLALAAYLPGKIKTTTRHPLLAAIKLWATAHLLSNGTLPAVLLFGSFLAWAIADRIALKKRRNQPPIEALAAASRNDAIALVGGVALYVLFVWRLHVWLIGVQPLL
jgi:uncharacterized membrane protein